MSVVEKLISEQNQYDLFYNILLSVKSKNPDVRTEEDVKKGKYILETNGISILKTDDVRTDIASFNIRIEREELKNFFSKVSYKYKITIDGSTRNYSSFNQMNFKSDTLSNKCKKVISDLFDYLFNIEEQRKIERTNIIIKNIIIDISSTVDKSFKRDNKIDEVLNN
jgi:hypothetical protein